MRDRLTRFSQAAGAQIPDATAMAVILLVVLIAVALGLDPVTAYSASAPLPKHIGELMVAGFLKGSPVQLVKCKTVDLEVPANAEGEAERRARHRKNRRLRTWTDTDGMFAGAFALLAVFRGCAPRDGCLAGDDGACVPKVPCAALAWVGKRADQRVREADPVGDTRHQVRAGARGQGVAIGADFHRGGRRSTLHPHGDLLESGLRASLTCIIPAQEVTVMYSRALW